MENKEIAQTLRLLSQLMELHQENPFKIKSVANAAFQIDKLPFSISNKSLNEIDQIAGLGKSIATKVLELVQTKHLKELDELIKKTPEGIIEMLQIKGIGPKKIYTIWKDLAIENCGELYYACNENRLIEAKGFGLKTQETIKKAIEFRIANSGYFLYAKIEPFAEALIIKLQEVWPKASVFLVGDYRRRCEIIDSLTILTTNPSRPLVVDQLKNIDLNIFKGINERGTLGNLLFYMQSVERNTTKGRGIITSDYLLNSSWPNTEAYMEHLMSTRYNFGPFNYVQVEMSNITGRYSLYLITNGKDIPYQKVVIHLKLIK